MRERVCLCVYSNVIYGVQCAPTTEVMLLRNVVNVITKPQKHDVSRPKSHPCRHAASAEYISPLRISPSMSAFYVQDILTS